MAIEKWSLRVARDVVLAVCMSVPVIFIASLFFVGQAGALPLCEGTSGVRCREDVEAAINVVIESLRDGAPTVEDGKSGISDYANALGDFRDARVIITNMDLSVTDRCKTASDEDELALHKAALGVADTYRLPADRFISSEAFTATHTALAALARAMINAVDNNLHEIELIGGFNPDHMVLAKERLAGAANDLALGNLAGAAGKAESAYDAVDGDGNVPPVCLAQVRAPCPVLPEPTSVAGDMEFNNTIRSQMWITDDGVWWGAFADILSSPPGLYFHQRVSGAFVRGALIDEAVLFEGEFVAGKPDTLWNGSHLFILVYTLDASDPLGSPPLARFYKYSYAPDTQTYSLLGGFPIDLPLSSNLVTDIAFDQDSTGRLWATYTDSSDGTLHVIWSTSVDHKVWNTKGTILASGLATDTEEAATVVPFGKGRIGVVWSNQADGEIGFRSHQANGEIGFRFRPQGSVETTWSAKETIDCCEGLPGVADNHLSLRAAPDDRLWLIAKNDVGNGQLHLYIRSVDGLWGQKTIVDPDPFAATTRPNLLLDLENDEAYVLYHDSNKDGRLFFVRTGMPEAPSFTHPCVFIDRDANNVTSTKQSLAATTGLIAAASGDDLISTNFIDLASPPEFPTEPAVTPGPETLQAQSEAQAPTSQATEGTPVAAYGAIWEGRLSRSETPKDVSQWRWLRAQRVNTIVTLDHQRTNVGKFDFENFLWMPLDPGTPPTNAAAERMLRFVQDRDHQPSHIQAGALDLIAMLTALIRYAVDGQTMEAALAEAQLVNAGQELPPPQAVWLRTWASEHQAGSHRRN